MHAAATATASQDDTRIWLLVLGAVSLFICPFIGPFVFWYGWRHHKKLRAQRREMSVEATLGMVMAGIATGILAMIVGMFIVMAIMQVVMIVVAVGVWLFILFVSFVLAVLQFLVSGGATVLSAAGFLLLLL